MPVYEVEIDGKRYDIEGDRPPTEAEARQAVGAYTQESAAHTPAHTPPQRGAVSRFLAPFGDAARGLASLPGAAVEALSHPGTDPLGLRAGAKAAYGALVEPSLSQARQGIEAAGRGDYGEAALRALATADVGGAGADIGESVAEGDIAGAAGKATLLAAPGARVERFARPTSIAGLLKNRAAARMLDIMRPSEKRMKTAREIALEVVQGTPGRQAAGGVGVGNIDTLARRAVERSKAAGKAVEALQQIDTPVNPSRVSKALRDEAVAKETHLPTGRVVTEDRPLVSALRAQADAVDDMAASFGGEVPAGELFKQRAVSNRRFGKSRQNLPGDVSTAKAEAANARSSQTSDLLHDEDLWGEGGLGGSKIIDRENRVWRNAAINLERAGLRDLHSLRGLKQLLAGRAVGMAARGIAGFGTGMATGFGPIAGVAGALGGVALGESVKWGSFRAHHYAKLARLLDAGELDKAADLVQRVSATAAVEEGIREREKRRRAQQALRSQAEGVIAP